MRHFVLSVLCLALTGCGWDQTTLRSDKPVSRAVASKDISLPFPPSTKDVYYVFHAGGMQEMQMLVRFAIDPKDLEGTVSNLLSDHDKVTQEHHFYISAPIGFAPHSPEFKDLLPMPWWKPDSITNGYYCGATNGQPFHIWVDVPQHTIYVCASD
jgi:hypothetical protein